MLSSCLKKPGLSVDVEHGLYPSVDGLKDTRYNLEKIWMEISRKGKSANVHIARIISSDLNFGYCSNPKRNQVRIWSLTGFVSTFDITTWVLLTGAFLAISKLLQNHGKYSQIFLQNGTLTAYSLLLGMPSSTPLQKCSIAIIWLLCCQCLDNYYLGHTASKIIKPLQLITIKNFPELHQCGYNLMFRYNVELNYTTAVSKYIYNSSDSESLRNLLKRNASSTNDISTLIKRLTNGQKLAVVDRWFYVISMVSAANDYLKESMGPKHDIVHCYIGKRLIDSGGHYSVSYTLKGPNRMSDISNILQQSGIQIYWNTLLVQMQYSRRVQDQTRVVSPTKIIYDFESEQPKALHLKGKTVTVFGIWVAGISGSFLIFVPTLLRKFVRDHWL